MAEVGGWASQQGSSFAWQNIPLDRTLAERLPYPSDITF